MSIRGSLSTMPAEDVLEWAGRRRLTATVTFERQQGGANLVRSLGIVDGAVTWASSNRPEEQLGAVLVKSGTLAERSLIDALEARSETGVPLGKVLQMAGAVHEDSLVETLATKIREAVTDLVTWTDGTFDLVQRAVPPSAGVTASIGVDVCLNIARRRSTRLAQAVGLIGGDDSSFYVPPSVTAVPEIEPEGAIDGDRLWKLVQDGLTVAQLTAALGGERFNVIMTIAAWLEADALVVDRRRRSRTDTALELAQGAKSRLKDGDRAGALQMAHQALQQDPGDAEVRRVYAAAERSRVAEIARLFLGRHAVPRRPRTAPPLDKANLSPLERELAERIDGRWDLLSLIRSASAREAEALLAFARLTELGIVELA
jgi:hypothetical protein